MNSWRVLNYSNISPISTKSLVLSLYTQILPTIGHYKPGHIPIRNSVIQFKSLSLGALVTQNVAIPFHVIFQSNQSAHSLCRVHYIPQQILNVSTLPLLNEYKLLNLPLKIAGSWDVMPCGLVSGYQCSEGWTIYNDMADTFLFISTRVGSSVLSSISTVK
jgi:hypothetical protein